MERVNPLPVFPLVVILLFLAVIHDQLPSSNAHIGEFDEYWKNKEAEAKRVLNEAYHPDPYNVTNHLNYHVHMAVKKNKSFLNSTRRSLAGKYDGPCIATNPIDQCWRCKSDWEKNRKHLADCVLGFGRGTTGGKAGKFYTVTDPSDNDMVNPKPGTLRYAVIQVEPLWIIFARPMNIRLSEELMVNSHKTIDARGSQVHIYGAGITVQFVKNVIIHGLHVHNISPGKGGMIRDSVNHYGFRTRSDGDAISIFSSSYVWVDHCSLAKATDGLIDIIQGSTAITLSNNHMMDHDEVFLFGAHNSNQDDAKMQITVAFNHFGKGLVQRMPRCRWGFVHVVNNDYTHWLMYAIGGSQHPIILSQGNRFIAPPNVLAKEVTKRGAPESDWKHWSWRSENDYFLNGAYFRQSGSRVTTIDALTCVDGRQVGELTRFTGPRKCVPGKKC